MGQPGQQSGRKAEEEVEKSRDRLEWMHKDKLESVCPPLLPPPVVPPLPLPLSSTHLAQHPESLKEDGDPAEDGAAAILPRVCVCELSQQINNTHELL